MGRDKKPSDWVDTSTVDDLDDKLLDDWTNEKRIVDEKRTQTKIYEISGDIAIDEAQEQGRRHAC